MQTILENLTPDLQHQIGRVYREDSHKVLATLIRLLKDFDLAEDAMHEAFAAAVRQWPIEGIPHNPLPWLVSAGRFKAIDAIRKRQLGKDRQLEINDRLIEVERRNAEKSKLEIEDDQLRLIFTCCHPAIDPKVQVPLVLREICGMTTDQIASAFLTSSTAMAQRIVRGKNKIKLARIPYEVPNAEQMPERLEAVLDVIYLVFNEGYSPAQGQHAVRDDLADEAIRLGRLVLDLLPDAEVKGLLALMLFHQSRRATRTDEAGDIVLLEDQDRSRWERPLIEEATQLIRSALQSDSVGYFWVQAAIAAVHANAESSTTTNWDEIVQLYDLLFKIQRSPIVQLNRSVAIAMRDGPEAGLRLISEIIDRGQLASYSLVFSAQADLMRRLNRDAKARAAYVKALELSQQEPERRFLQKRIMEIDLKKT